MAHKLSVWRILKRDWLSFGLSIWVGLFGLMALVLIPGVIWHPEHWKGFDFTAFIAGWALFATALAGPVLVWRVRVIRRVFARGEMVRGRVLYVVEGDGECSGYAGFVYQYQGHEYRAKAGTDLAFGRAAVAPDDSVEIVVDPSKPSRAFISKLYLQ